jgi:hypothetical protein
MILSAPVPLLMVFGLEAYKQARSWSAKAGSEIRVVPEIFAWCLKEKLSRLSAWPVGIVNINQAPGTHRSQDGRHGPFAPSAVNQCEIKEAVVSSDRANVFVDGRSVAQVNIAKAMQGEHCCHSPVPLLVRFDADDQFAMFGEPDGRPAGTELEDSPGWIEEPCDISCRAV